MERVITAERNRVGMTQRELAALVGITPKTMGKYERDPLSAPGRVLFRIADQFGVTPDYLVARSDSRKG